MNKPVCGAKHSWTLYLLVKYRPPTTVWRCAVLNAPHWMILLIFSLLFSHSDISHYSMVIHALIYWHDDPQVLSDKMQRGSMSLHAKITCLLTVFVFVCLLTEPRECE